LDTGIMGQARKPEPTLIQDYCITQVSMIPSFQYSRVSSFPFVASNLQHSYGLRLMRVYDSERPWAPQAGGKPPAQCFAYAVCLMPHDKFAIPISKSEITKVSSAYCLLPSAGIPALLELRPGIYQNTHLVCPLNL
jgi:hypothetical protein